MSYHELYAATWRKVFSRFGWDGSEPRTVVEIGSYEGASAVWIARNLLTAPGSRLYCIDGWQGLEEQRARFTRNIAALPDPGLVTVLDSTSRKALVRLEADGVKADFVYVDGSHAAPDVLSDLVLGFGLLKVGGVLICDDYLWADERYDGGSLLGRPKLAIDAFTTIFADKITWAANVSNLQAILQKRAD